MHAFHQSGVIVKAEKIARNGLQYAEIP